MKSADQVFTAIRSVILSFNMFNGFKYHNFVFKKQPKLQGMEVIFCARALIIKSCAQYIYHLSSYVEHI